MSDASSEHIAANFFLCLLIVATFVVGMMFLPYLSALVLAVVLSVLFHPVYKRLLKLMPKWGGFAAFISTILAIVIILIPLTFFGVIVFHEAQNVYASSTSGNGSQIANLIREQVSRILPSVSINFSQYASGILGWFISNIGPIFSQIAAITLTLFLTLFAMYYFLKDGEKMHSAVLRVSPLKHEDTEKILDKLMKMVGSVIKGSLVVCTLQGIAVGIGFYIFGLPNPVLWGFVAIICSFVPVIGPAIVVVPTAIMMWISGNAAIAIGFVLWGLLLPGAIDNLIRPRLIDRDTNINPVLILFSVIGGIAVFGPIGLFFGPLMLSLLLTLIEISPTIFRGSNIGA